MHLNGSNGTSNKGLSLNNSQESQEQEIDFIKIFNLLFLNKWKIVSITFFLATLAAIISLLMTPIYRSSGTIFISESKNRYSYAGSDLSNLLTTTYGIGMGSTIANEIQILRSRKLSFQLAQRISELEYDENGNKFPILYRSYPDNPETIGIDTVAARYRKLITFDVVSPDADLVSITFESPSATESSTIVNITMDTYSALSTDQNRTMAVSALSFLKGEKEKINHQLTITEDSLRSFMNETNLISVDPQSRQLIDKIAEIESERKSIEVQLVAVNSAIYEFENQLNEIKPGLAERYSEALGIIIQRYQFSLAEAETEKLQYLTRNSTVDDTHPEIIKLDNEIALIKEKIKSLTTTLVEDESVFALSFTNQEGQSSLPDRLANISNNLLDLNISKTQLETQQDVYTEYFNELDEQFENLPNDIIALSRLQRDVKINEEMYLLVSNQFAEMSLWEKTQFGLGRPLDYAEVPKLPYKPRKKIISLIGLFIGGLLSVGYIVISDLVNDKIRSTETLKGFKYPLLGSIPDFSVMGGLDANGRQYIDNRSVSNQLITFLDHISPISEAYRRLRINVIYANPDKEYKVIMVTSATKGEGKSTVAANLAVTFSEAEKKVLLIDLDLRRPTQHKIFGENREPGLTEMLFDTLSASSVIRNTIAPNVNMITVGRKTPEPATVLDSKRLKQLIDKLKDQYDHIILDTAPYGIISDSASLLRLVDGLVVVSRFNVTTKRELVFTLDGLKHLNADVLGLVLNAFNPEKSTDYYTSYSYYKRTYYTDYYKEDA